MVRAVVRSNSQTAPNGLRNAILVVFLGNKEESPVGKHSVQGSPPRFNSYVGRPAKEGKLSLEKRQSQIIYSGGTFWAASVFHSIRTEESTY